MCGSTLREVERAAKRKFVAAYLGMLHKKKVCGSILREVERAAKGKHVAVYFGRLREKQKESVWQYTYGG